MKEMCKLRYEFKEFAHRKVDKVIEEMEQMKFTEKRDDTSQQEQIGHVVTDMDELIYAHPSRGAEPDCIVVWLLLKAHSGARRAARLWQEFFRNAVLFMRAGWHAEALEPNVYHKAEDLNDGHDASMYVHGDDFMVEVRISVFQDVKVMLEQNVGLEALTIIGPGQNTKAKIVKRVSSWRPAGITWVRLEQSRAAALTPSTATTTRTTRNTSDELSWERAKAISLAGGTAICLVLDRLDIAYNLREANRDM